MTNVGGDRNISPGQRRQLDDLGLSMSPPGEKRQKLEAGTCSEVTNQMCEKIEMQRNVQNLTKSGKNFIAHAISSHKNASGSNLNKQFQ